MRRIGLMALACLLLAGCATLKPVDQAKVDGMWTRKAAEDAYISIRVAYPEHVSPADMDRTVELMRAWHAAYVALVDAIVAWEAGDETADLDALMATAREAAVKLQAFAVVVLSKPAAKTAEPKRTVRSPQWIPQHGSP